MTVSFLFGWGSLLTGLVLLVALAVIFLLVLSAGRGRRSEWQAFLDARSLARPDLPGDEDASTDVGSRVSRQQPR
jgi:cell division septation protein DedD